MSIVDVDVLLQELGAGSPCGPNLEYDPAFLALEQSAQGKPEVQYGGTIVAAVPPEWKDVKRQALELLGRTRDLRVAMPLVRALLALHAIPGFADGLRLVERLVEERWDSVHPELDADDGNDPTQRLNALVMLTDAATLLRELRDTTVVQLPSLGALSLRLLDQINGDLPVPAGQTVPNLASVQAALRDVPAEAFQDALDTVAAALGSATQLETVLMREVGAAQALDMAPLMRQLRRVHDVLASSRPQAVVAEPAQDTVQGMAQQASQADAAPAAAAGSTATGDIASPADVLRMLDKILAYYARSEPSSPVPILLERAKRLAPKSFIEVLEDLAPDGMGQLRIIRGPLAGGQEQ